jgi:chondroitin-sulfate-ABC endolyase/exolyase
MAAFAAAPPYRVLRRDTLAHILRDNPSRTTGYVVFEADQPVGEDVVSASVPCLLMIKDLDGGRRKLSYCNPDLGRQYANTGVANEEEMVATVTLKGVWTLAGDVAGVRAGVVGGNTTLTFHTRGAKPVVVGITQKSR